MLENQRITDALEVALSRAKGLVDGAGLVGYGVVELRGPNGALKQVEPFHNIVTTAGDKFYAQLAAQASGGAAPSPGAPTGMKLGTGGATAASKSGAGAAIASNTYITGSNKTFTPGAVVAAVVSGDTGWTVAYESVWAAGTSTNAAITEVAIVNDAVTNATATAANTYARAAIALVNKGAQDSLTVTWKHLFLGA